MKGLFLRGNIWWFRFTPARGAAQVQMTLKTSDESKAIELARDALEDGAKEATEAMQGCEWEIAAYIDTKRRRGLAKSTLSTRGYVLRGFVKDAKVASPDQITRSVVLNWFNVRHATNPQTAEDYMQIVRLWLQHLVEVGKLQADPAKDIVLPTIKKRLRRVFLPTDDAKRLLAACDCRPVPKTRGHEKRPPSTATFKDDGLKFAVYCGLHLGLRKLEIIEARPAWFDLDAGLVHVQTTETFEPKDRDNRTVPLTDEFREWLRPYMKQLPKGAKFMLAPAVPHGDSRYRFDFRKAFAALTTACELEHITFHDLRRTFASLLVSKGISIYKVAKWMGDLVSVVEDTYGHLIPQDEEINAAWK